MSAPMTTHTLASGEQVDRITYTAVTGRKASMPADLVKVGDVLWCPDVLEVLDITVHAPTGRVSVWATDLRTREYGPTESYDPGRPAAVCLLPDDERWSLDSVEWVWSE